MFNNTNHPHPGCPCPPPPPPPHPRFPTGGPMDTNAFVINNSHVFLLDNTRFTYGGFLNVADAVYTRFTQQRDPSCVNITATIDLSENVLTNTVLNSYVTQLLEQQYETVNQLLNIMKENMNCKLYYEVLDGSNQIVASGNNVVTVQEPVFHYTDIRDYFLTSLKNLFIFNLPALQYQGLYTLRFTKFEVIASTITTATHITPPLNPYYQFTDNNTKIAVQHEEIEEVTEADDTAVIAEVTLDQSFPFQGNVTTRVRVSFTAFMSGVVSTRNTFEVWQAMFEPTSQRLDDIETDIAALDTRVDALENGIITQSLIGSCLMDNANPDATAPLTGAVPRLFQISLTADGASPTPLGETNPGYLMMPGQYYNTHLGEGMIVVVPFGNNTPFRYRVSLAVVGDTTARELHFTLLNPEAYTGMTWQVIAAVISIV